ncbi:type I polyketide synthase [Actinacidiphila oryziradicis]|uniref:type I polyketide synthase n=1 Tax=Actinacidiphila oryziradicis TaxID=2571141 RepID=UPI001FE50518|nr:type I polyketide synthase [Actinacidiphila oryziradicis]
MFLGEGDALADVAAALVGQRSLWSERAVVIADSRDEALAGLGAVARGEAASGVVSGRAGAVGKTVLVFPGQGSQWVGMGRELLDSSPVFAARIAECAAALEPWVDWSLTDVLRGGALDRVDVVQPASFAVMVALAAVWESLEVVADAVVGHSQGEIAAACVAGALSLEDAARIVAVRSQVIARDLAGRGGMASVALSEAEAHERVGRWSGRVEVAAVNGPSSVVLAGDAEALDEALKVLEEEGVRVRRVAVDYASHTSHVVSIEGALGEAFAGIRSAAPRIPFLSTVTGEWVEDAGVLDGGYWFRNLRRQVRFAPAIEALIAQGHKVFVEASAHPVLVQSISEIADDAIVVTGSLRRDEGGLRRLLTSVAELFVRGVPVDWTALLPEGAGAAAVELPTYAFDHEHYWLPVAPPATDAVSLGLAGVDHPMLGAVVALPNSAGFVFTSRLSLRTHPWIGDHVVAGVVIVPGTGLVELAVRAGDEAGCSVLEELVIEAPLVVPERGGVRVHVVVGGATGTDGSRSVEVYSQREDDPDEDGTVWTRHASGVVSMAPGATETTQRFDAGEVVWPPADAEPVDIGSGYDVLARGGYGYGPVFRCVRAVWRRGDDVFAEVALPADEPGAAYGIHPALLDAALHSTMLDTVAAAGVAGADGPPENGDGEGREGSLGLPFAWNGLRLSAAGASALRVRVHRLPGGDLSMEAVDEFGGPVVTLDSLVSRPVSVGALEVAASVGRTTRAGSLYGVEWVSSEPGPVSAGFAPAWVPVADAEAVATLADEVESGAAGLPAAAVADAVSLDEQDAVLALTNRVLEIVQCWLDGTGLEDARLVVATRGAVPAAGEATVTDPGAAAVWGLVRAAQAENPDRIVLLDLDADAEVESVLPAVLASGEPEVAVRGSRLFVPRLARVAESRSDAVFGPDGTVLVSGAGSLGGVVARHLVVEHGVRRLVLASRRGPDAAGMAELVEELTGLGAEASAVACDLSDRDEVAALLASIPAEHRLRGVVHTAGVSDAGVIATVTPERLARLFAPKVDAVLHLDALTRDLDLDAFVVYSSVSSVFMGAGSGGYAAANAFLDGLMASRRAAGLPGLALAWGLWDQTSGMAQDLDDLTRARMNRRGGLLPMSVAEGMELFRAAVGSARSLLVPAKLDLRGVRADAAAGGVVPHMLRGLVRVGRQLARSATATAAGGDRPLAERLAGLTGAEQSALLLDLVRAQIAAVLGFGTSHHLDADQGLFEIGFDSLTAIELRNRLRTMTERKLSPGLVFDHPTPAMLAAHLHTLLGGEATLISI